MSSVRPLMDLRSHWRDCGRIDWNSRFFESAKHSANISLSRSQHEVLCRTIEADIIPRLILAHSEDGVLSEHVFENASPLNGQDIEHFVGLLLDQDISEAESFSAAVRARGIALDIVFLELFVPAARHLGELWERDICDFVEVTIALSRLQQLLRKYSPDFEGEVVPAVNARRAFLAVLPGDQHTFGLFVVREFFRRAGWHVDGGVYDSAEELLSVARSMPFDVVGLSIGCDAAVGDLATLVRSLKRSALNPAARVLVGGRFILEHPELVTTIGADATAPDGRGAIPGFPTCLT